MHKEDYEDEDDGENGRYHRMWKPMKKEFKIAMLEKKEKIMQAKMEFIGKMKDMIKKMPENDED